MFGVDDALFAAGIGAVGSGVAGWLGYQGQEDTNRSNRRIAEMTNRANSAMSLQQMQFQERMSNSQMAFQERMSGSAYQRAISDMRKAGINPMLAYAQGGASSPPGASASGSAIPNVTGAPMDNSIGRGLSSAFEAKRLHADLEKIKSDVDLNRALVKSAKEDAVLKSSSARKVQADTKLVESAAPKSQFYGNLFDKANKIFSFGESTAKKIMEARKSAHVNPNHSRFPSYDRFMQVFE